MQTGCFECLFVSLVFEALKIPLIIQYLLANVRHITLGTGQCFRAAVNLKEKQQGLPLNRIGGSKYSVRCKPDLSDISASNWCINGLNKT